MAVRKIYFVSPDGAYWKLSHNGSTVTRHALKAMAVEAGRQVAKANAPSSLKIMRANGTIEDENTYGGDPFPPRG